VSLEGEGNRDLSTSLNRSKKKKQDGDERSIEQLINREKQQQKRGENKSKIDPRREEKADRSKQCRQAELKEQNFAGGITT